MNKDLHPALSDCYNLPYTIATAVRKQVQIDSFLELPKNKKPPKSIWHNDYKLNEWFEAVFDDRSNHSDTMEFNIDEVE